MEPQKETKDTPMGKPRRPHHKSRTGCLQCKQRKIKCDETKPVCKKCSHHNQNQSCSYLQTHPLKRGPPTVQSMLASPSPTSSTPNSSLALKPPPTPVPLTPVLPANFTMLDLELLHFWTTQSVESFVDFNTCIRLFRTTVVELGIVHPFLMHEILALSAVHLAQVRPHKAAFYKQASGIHLAAALELFQPEIANITAANCDACFAFSTSIFTHAWASQDIRIPSALFFAPSKSAKDSPFFPLSHTVPDDENPDVMHVQWVGLQRGTHNILSVKFPERMGGVMEGPLEPLFAPWRALDPNRPNPLPPHEEAQLSALSSAWSRPSCTLSATQKCVLDNNLEKLRRVYSMLHYNPEISKLSCVMSWFSQITEEFLHMVEEKIPEAMLVIVFYCVTLKKADNMWWVRGKGENLLRTMLAELGGGWEDYTRWPVERLLGRQEAGSLNIAGVLG